MQSKKRPAASGFPTATKPPVPSWPKITLEFDLEDFRLVESFYDPGPQSPNSATPRGPFLRCNKPDGGKSNPAYESLDKKPLDWVPGDEPHGDKAFAFLFVRVKRHAKKKRPAQDWLVLQGLRGSAAYTLAPLKQANTGDLKWCRDFCGYTNNRTCALAPYFQQSGYGTKRDEQTGEPKPVTIRFDALKFPPANITINVFDGKKSLPANDQQVEAIERALHNLRDWGEAKDFSSPHEPKPPKEEEESTHSSPPPVTNVTAVSAAFPLCDRDAIPRPITKAQLGKIAKVITGNWIDFLEAGQKSKREKYKTVGVLQITLDDGGSTGPRIVIIAENYDQNGDLVERVPALLRPEMGLSFVCEYSYFNVQNRITQLGNSQLSFHVSPDAQDKRAISFSGTGLDASTQHSHSVEGRRMKAVEEKVFFSDDIKEKRKQLVRLWREHFGTT